MIREFGVRTSRRNELIDITSEIRSIIEESGIEEGYCHIFVPHTTAAVTINEKADPNVSRDISGSMEKIVPANWGYTHAEGNSDSHIKSSMVGVSELVPVRGGKPVLGTWQAVFFCEFDGPRGRKCLARVSE
ncbi:MAG: secondary thiamine-phosphate synthase enzyme YjbQ [Candidatus Krumholzibacteriales bacterium]